MHDPLGRHGFDPHDGRAVGLAQRHPLLDPTPQQPIGRRVDFEPLAAAMGTLPGRLGQQQRTIGSGRKDAPPVPLLDQRVVIERRVDSHQRQLEPVLARCLAVAAAAVAAEFAQDRLDVVGEIDGTHHAVALHLDRHVDRQLMTVGRIGRADFDVDSAVAGRNHHAVVDAGDLRVGRTILDLVRHVGHAAVRTVGGDDQLHAFVGGAQRHRRRLDRQMIELGCAEQPAQRPPAGRSGSRGGAATSGSRRGCVGSSALAMLRRRDALRDAAGRQQTRRSASGG